MTLVISSCGFLIPAILAHQSNFILLGILFILLTITSILYHNSYGYYIGLLDRCVAMSLTLILTTMSLFLYYKTNNYLFAIAMLSGILASITYLINTNTIQSNTVHIFIHIIGVIGFSAYTVGLSEKHRCSVMID